MNPMFRPFPSLPLELRLKIWSHLLPAPRIVDIIAISTDERQQFCSFPNDTTISSPKLVTSFVDHLQSPHQSLSALYYVNRETRTLLLKKWKALQGIQVLGKKDMRAIGFDRFEEEERTEPVRRTGWRVKGPEAQATGGQDSIFYLHPPSLNTTPVLFNPDIDLLFLADPPSTRKVSSLSVLVRWLDKDIVESVKNLAIPYYSWRKDNTFGKIGSLREFMSLQRLWVAFVGDEGRENAGWLAAVDRGEVGSEQGEPYLCEIREQIRGDLAMEKALFGWERPVVRVVKDRGVVMRELGECGAWVRGMGRHGCFPHCECMRTPERVTE